MDNSGPSLVCTPLCLIPVSALRRRRAIGFASFQVSTQPFSVSRMPTATTAPRPTSKLATLCIRSLVLSASLSGAFYDALSGPLARSPRIVAEKLSRNKSESRCMSYRCCLACAPKLTSTASSTARDRNSNINKVESKTSHQDRPLPLRNNCFNPTPGYRSLICY